jgi:hypothetical protein
MGGDVKSAGRKLQAVSCSLWARLTSRSFPE